MLPFIRSPFNYDTELASDESALHEFSQTKTQQQFKDECDINRIVKQFAGNGILPIGNPATPLDPDTFYGITDFQSAQNAVRRGKEAFAALPSNIRSQFQNDPQLFVDFVLNPDNIEAVRDLGLAPKLEPKSSNSATPLTPEGGAAQAAAQ